jgi:hypothetical protein
MAGILSWFRQSEAANENRLVSPLIEHVASQLTVELGQSLVNISHYPHPCTRGGLVVVFKDDVEDLLDLVATSYVLVPRTIVLHCLRQSEIPELSLPVITWLDVVNTHLQMPFWLRHRGINLYGAAIHEEIRLPENPQTLLRVHLDVCAHSLRNHVILGCLTRKDYLGLIKKLDWQARCLMTTALLPYNDWDVEAETLSQRFTERYPDPELGHFWDDLSGVLYSTNVVDEASCRQSAFESVWLFESFLQRLRAYA